MASDESMTSSFEYLNDDDDDDMDDPQPHNNMCVCSSSSLCGIDEDEVSQLSVESLEEFPDGKERALSSSDSDRVVMGEVKYYCSDTKKEEEEEDQSRGVMVITKPKGGRRSLCMDMEEVKACQELGFELEHLQLPSSPLSHHYTTTAANSPFSNWRISTPGDDPRHVKARLKMWAQAVALASASKYAN